MDRKSLIEGLIFASGEKGIAFIDLQKAISVSPDFLQDLLTEIEQDYKQRGFHLQKTGMQYRFVSDPEIYPVAKTVFETIKKKSLSPAALETLSIIAYRQPVSTAEVEAIRGVSCDSILSHLLEMELIDRVSQPNSRMNYYKTNDRFLRTFGIQSLDELPEIENEE